MRRKLNISFILILFTLFSFGQIDTEGNNSRQTFYSNGSPKTSCVYNKSSKLWSCTEYYINGKILSNYYCDSSSYFAFGLKKAFDLYGDIAYVVNYENELLHGPFI